jgi:predicted 3-demethylubiquinone-9 3-methyltransferase (glyoxalase superfamily)
MCGWLKDKFGISWQVISPELGKYLGGESVEGSQAATKAMMSMNKIDLGVLRLAYEAASKQQN